MQKGPPDDRQALQLLFTPQRAAGEQSRDYARVGDCFAKYSEM